MNNLLAPSPIAPPPTSLAKRLQSLRLDGVAYIAVILLVSLAGKALAADPVNLHENATTSSSAHV